MSAHPVDSMLGLYIFKAGAAAPMSRRDGWRCVARPARRSCTKLLRPLARGELHARDAARRRRADHPGVMPTTYGAGQAGPFALQLASDARLSWQELL